MGDFITGKNELIIKSELTVWPLDDQLNGVNR